MSFTHPLARDAKVWPTGGCGGSISQVLVIITTLSLDANDKHYKGDKVERLKDAAKEWLNANENEAVDFMLINRAKAW